MTPYQSFVKKLPYLELDKKYQVNKGGCGHFALITHRILKEIGIETQICLRGKFEISLEEYKNKSEDSKRECFSHVYLKYGNRFFDVNGEIEWGEKEFMTYTPYKILTVSSSTLEDLLTWNIWKPTYKVENNDVIAKYLDFLIKKNLQNTDIFEVLIKQLPTLKLDETYNINPEGCGQFAFVMYNLLADNGVKLEIYMQKDKSSLFQVTDTSDCFYHILLKYKDIYFDCNGNFDWNSVRNLDETKYLKKIDIITLEEMLKKSDWLPSYNPANNKKITCEVKKLLKKIVLSNLPNY